MRNRPSAFDKFVQLCIYFVLAVLGVGTLFLAAQMVKLLRGF